MKINQATMLFTDISAEQRKEMQKWAEDAILRGMLAWPDPQWVTDWLAINGFDWRQRLLVLSTVLPARVTLSLLLENNKSNEEFRQYCCEKCGYKYGDTDCLITHGQKPSHEEWTRIER